MNTTTPNFSNILKGPVGSAERPKPVPVGTYVALVQGQPRFDKSQQKQTPFVEFQMKLLQPMGDVDTQALQEMGGLGERTQRLTFYLTEDALWRLDEFLKNLDLEGIDREQAISQAPGRQCAVTIRHAASQDGTAVFANIAGTAKL